MIQAIDLTQKQTQFLYLIVSQSTALRRIREVYVFGTIEQITMKVQRKCGGGKSLETSLHLWNSALVGVE